MTRHSITTADGLTLAVHHWGEAGAAPPVVLHHGFGVSAQINWVFPGVVAALTGAGRQVLGVDARGHGQSDKPHDPAFYGEAKMAADLGAMADQLGLTSFDLVGYSMGAIVSLIAGSQEPRIRRLVIGGVGDGILATGGVDTRVVPNLAIVQALTVDDPADISHPAAAPFRQMADATGADRLALAAQAQVVHAQAIPLEKITAPTLIIAGSEDPLAAHPERLAEAITGASFVGVPGDHRSAVGEKAFAEAILAFLA